MTKEELLTALLVERFGKTVPEYHPRPNEHDSDAAWNRLRVLHEATWDFYEREAG